MTTEKAYYVLKAHSSESLKVIKKRYKELAKKYHPDLYEGKSEEEQHYAKEKLQEINNAYEIIKKTKENSFENNTFNEVLERLKIEKLEAIHSFFDEEGEVFLKSLYGKKALSKINELTDLLFLYSDKIEKSRSEVNIRNWYYAWTINIENYLEQVKKDYCKKNDLLETEIIYKVSTFNQFIMELEKQKEKSKAIWEEIEKEAQKYTYYAGYDKIAEEIETIKHSFEKQIKEKKQNKNTLLEQMHQTITKKFTIYYEDKKKWKDLASVAFDELTQEELNELLLLQNYFGTENFMKKYQELSYIKKKVDYKKKEQEIRLLYLSLYEKARKEIERCSFSTDFNKIYLINKLLDYIWKIIEKAKNGLIEIAYLKQLQEISFQNFLKDKEILLSFHFPIHAKDIYIEKEEKTKEEADQIRWLQIENDWYSVYSFRPGYVPEFEKIQFGSIEEINQYYFSLNTFLEKAQPMFYNSSIGTTLYGYPKNYKQNYYCFLEEEEESIISIQIETAQNVEIKRDMNKRYTKFKDKNRIKQTIENQINKYQEAALQEEVEMIFVRRR